MPLPAVGRSLAGSDRALAASDRSLSERLPSEDRQLAWAATESLRLEEARRRRREQEQADLELAISLSKIDSGGK